MLTTQFAGKVLCTQQSGLCHAAPVLSRWNDHGVMPQWVSSPLTHARTFGIDSALQRLHTSLA
jgi:hypothetical protein